MRSRAEAENPWAWTVSGLVSSPLAGTLTAMPLRVARPFSRSVSSVTSAPLSKRASRSPRFTGWEWVRKFSNGIDCFLCGPRSLRIRMWIGFCPPSKPTLRLAPEREPAPFCPRPEVLPKPEPSPRPTRLRSLREPGAGLSECRPMVPGSVLSSGLRGSAIVVHLDEVTHAVEHPSGLGVVLDLDGVVDPPQAERAQRLALRMVRAV